MPPSAQKRQHAHWERVFKANLSEIASAAKWVESIAVSAELPPAQEFAMQVCLEEIMSNVVRHGKCHSDSSRPSRSGRDYLTIAIAIDAYEDRITMSVEDNGRPFNLGKAVAKKIDEPLEQLQPGGLGIHLIKSFSSTMEYQLTEQGNRITVEFMG
jgi:serine/threonine-protein kinase RsbW